MVGIQKPHTQRPNIGRHSVHVYSSLFDNPISRPASVKQACWENQQLINTGSQWLRALTGVFCRGGYPRQRRLYSNRFCFFFVQLTGLNGKKKKSTYYTVMKKYSSRLVHPYLPQISSILILQYELDCHLLTVLH